MKYLSLLDNIYYVEENIDSKHRYLPITISGLRYLFSEDKSVQYLLHRINAPAVETKGAKFWYYKGKRHREDGAACEYLDGRKFWFYHGQEIESDYSPS